MLDWTRLVLIVQKNEEKQRFWVDFRKLSTMAAREVYSFPRSDKVADSLEDAVIFSTANCNIGRWKVEIPEANRDKTIFFSSHWSLRSIRILLGVNSVLASFQRVMDIIRCHSWETRSNLEKWK